MSFDIAQFLGSRMNGHGGLLGIRFHAQGPDWIDLTLPFDEKLVGDPERGVIASGAIVTLMDMATSLAVWMKRTQFAPQATLDLRVDYLRPATPGKTVIGRGECLKITRSVAFVRGQAHDGDPDDPLALVAGTFMVLGE